MVGRVRLYRELLLLAEVLSDGEDLGGEKDQDAHDDHQVGEVERGVHRESRIGEQHGGTAGKIQP